MVDRRPLEPAMTVGAAEAIEVLERLLEGTALGAIEDTRPIAIVLDSATFVLDPSQPKIVAPGAPAEAALTLRTSPAVLVRLLTSPDMWLGKDEQLALEGDPRALEPLLDALRRDQSPLQTRLSEAVRSSRRR